MRQKNGQKRAVLPSKMAASYMYRHASSKALRAVLRRHLRKRMVKPRAAVRRGRLDRVEDTQVKSTTRA